MYLAQVKSSVSLLVVIASLCAIVLALTKGLRHRSASAKASSLFFGDHRLTVTDSSRSLFINWMNVGNVIVGGLVVAITYRYFAIWAVLTWVAGFFLLARHAPRIITMASDHTTINSFIRTRFQSPALGRIGALIGIVTGAGVVALELMVGAAILGAAGWTSSPIFEIAISVVILSVTAVAYTRLGGLSAVIANDRMHSIWAMVALFAMLLCAFFVPRGIDGPTVATVLADASRLELPGHQMFALVAFFVGFGTLQLFTLLGDILSWQRIQLGQNVIAVRRASLRAAYTTLIAWSVLLAAGLLLSRWPIEILHLPVVGGDFVSTIQSQSEPLPSLLAGVANGELGIPRSVSSVLLFLVVFGLISTALSTFDSFLLVGTQAFLFEWTKTGRKTGGVRALASTPEDQVLARRARALIPVFMLLALGIFVGMTASGIPLVSAIFFVLALQCFIPPLAVCALYAQEIPQRARSLVLWSFAMTCLVLVALFLLSAAASSVSLSYAYSYLAPIAAFGIPTAAIVFAGFRGGKSKELLGLISWFFRPPAARGDEKHAP